MEYSLKPSNFFLEQLDYISSKGKRIIEEKLNLVKINPYWIKINKFINIAKTVRDKLKGVDTI